MITPSLLRPCERRSASARLGFSTFVMSCTERWETLQATLGRLRDSGWSEPPEVVLDDGEGTTRLERIHRTWRRVVRRAAEASTEFVLLCEDDLVFGSWFPQNLRSWPLLQALPGSRAFYASLYNPDRPYLLRRPTERYLVADPRFVWGAQALVLTPQTARYIDVHWDECPGNPDQRMPMIAARVTPIYYHVPSLVDHAPVPTTWGGMEHTAFDFDPDFRASRG
jgi:hypothetical protein